ncbi:hypothetical protein F5144DRAFT_569104 [Chaetomium tenue]|uniref:Uncharacterized protein n=1 Tax=Chaetomium tenue TaxID=1854479 RepID=A0ACB7PCZ0_9PEZI|nr:hypothetical protein F5144DRAFT_569104 [Chaetomium globosum]
MGLRCWERVFGVLLDFVQVWLGSLFVGLLGCFYHTTGTAVMAYGAALFLFVLALQVFR